MHWDTVSYHFWLAKIQKFDSILCWWGWGEIGTLVHFLVVWISVEGNLAISSQIKYFHLPFDPAIPFLGIYHKDRSGPTSHFKTCEKPHSAVALSSEGGTLVGREHRWTEWGLRQQRCKVSSAAASLGRTSKDYNRMFPGTVHSLLPPIPGLQIV